MEKPLLSHAPGLRTSAIVRIFLAGIPNIVCGGLIDNGVTFVRIINQVSPWQSQGVTKSKPS